MTVTRGVVLAAALALPFILAPVPVGLVGTARAQGPDDLPDVDLPVEVTIDVVTDFDDLDGAVELMLDDLDDDVTVLTPGDGERHDHDDGEVGEHDDDVGGDHEEVGDDIGGDLEGFDGIDEGHDGEDDDH